LQPHFAVEAQIIVARLERDVRHTVQDDAHSADHVVRVCARADVDGSVSRHVRHEGVVARRRRICRQLIRGTEHDAVLSSINREGSESLCLTDVRVERHAAITRVNQQAVPFGSHRGRRFDRPVLAVIYRLSAHKIGYLDLLILFAGLIYRLSVI